MGLPQVSSGGISEEVAASLSNFVQTSPRIVNISCCDLKGKHGGNLANRMQLDLPCSSFGDFHKKIISESLSSDVLHMYKDGQSNTNGLKNGFVEQLGRLTSKSSQSIQTPLPRIVGFESKALHSSAEALNGNPSSSTVVSVTSNAAEGNGSLVRKRLLSPLSRMLIPDQFDGDTLNIAGGTYQSAFADKNHKYTFSASQEHKKAHIGNSGHFNPPVWSKSTFPEWKSLQDDSCGENSNYFTDVPFLENREIQSHNHFIYSSGRHYFSESTKVRSSTGAIAIPKKKVGSPLQSLSPLGPKFPERIESTGTCRYITRGIDDSYITLKDMKLSLDGTFSGILSSQKDENFSKPSKLSEGFDYLPKKFDVFTPEVATGTGWHLGQDLNLTPPCVKLVRSGSGLPVRRSLVGSFEESLLSGRLLSGKVSQRIGGFMAVLNVTGGNFSPKSQKLPFAVNSVDGDNYLLYYSSIGLAGNFPSNNGGGPRLKRSLSINDSQAENNRLRIPEKGRIQLVLSNPEKTPIHTFFCNYDLSDMPVGTKTFIRHKITLASSTPTSIPGNGRQRDSELKIYAKPSSAPNISHPLRLNMEFSDSSKPGIVDRSPTKSVKETETEDSDYNSKLVTDSRGFNCGEYVNIGGKDGSLSNLCKANVSKSVNSASKVSKNTTSVGVLRYALHLRFLCPFPKRRSRSVQRCKSDPSSVTEVKNKESEGERRFYLYNDMRVVFPQRHSDADEGKLLVEYDFPTDPKYFNISN